MAGTRSADPNRPYCSIAAQMEFIHPIQTGTCCCEGRIAEIDMVDEVYKDEIDCSRSSTGIGLILYLCRE